MESNQTAEAAECVIIRRESELRGPEDGNNRNALAEYLDLSAVTSGNGSVDKLRGSTIPPSPPLPDFKGRPRPVGEKEKEGDEGSSERKGERGERARHVTYDAPRNSRFASKSRP